MHITGHEELQESEQSITKVGGNSKKQWTTFLAISAVMEKSNYPFHKHFS